MLKSSLNKIILGGYPMLLFYRDRVVVANEVQPSKPPELASPPRKSQPRTIASSELLGGLSEVLIAHGGETYRLRLTRSGKLILQK